MLKKADTRFWVGPMGIAGRRRFIRSLALVVFALFTIAPAAHAQDSTIRAIQNIFNPLSTPAETLYQLSLLVLTVCAGIFLVVAGLLAYAICCVRFTPPRDYAAFAQHHSRRSVAGSLGHS